MFYEAEANGRNLYIKGVGYSHRVINARNHKKHGLQIKNGIGRWTNVGEDSSFDIR